MLRFYCDLSVEQTADIDAVLSNFNMASRPPVDEPAGLVPPLNAGLVELEVSTRVRISSDVTSASAVVRRRSASRPSGW